MGASVFDAGSTLHEAVRQLPLAQAEEVQRAIGVVVDAVLMATQGGNAPEITHANEGLQISQEAAATLIAGLGVAKESL